MLFFFSHSLPPSSSVFLFAGSQHKGDHYYKYRQQHKRCNYQSFDYKRVGGDAHRLRFFYVIDAVTAYQQSVGIDAIGGAGYQSAKVFALLYKQVAYIMRLYDVDQGRITMDNIDLRNIKQESLHSQIGVVLQETFLFSGTILANIRFARQDASMAEVIQAAKAANAHDFICKTPDGYNTYVGEHGHNLSGGERQRIAIARAILNNPRLLILDEATSALDTESEFLIQQALNRLVQGRTTFAIAHRLSTLRNADRLIVIDKHGIAEIGTHNELLEKKGIYYGLVTAQLAMAEGK